MKAQTLCVREIEEQSIGNKIRVKGMMYSHDFVCWLVPPNTKRTMHSKKQAILIKCPGLGAESFESDLARVTSGSPMVSIEEVEVVGHLDSYKHDEYKAVIDDVKLVIFRSAEKELVVDLGDIRNISKFKQSDIDSLNDEEFQERYRQKCYNERQM